MALTKIGTDGVKDDAVKTKHYGDNSIDTAFIADQAVTLAKLEHGTSSNDGKFLRANNGADPTFETVSAGPTIANQADNRVITATGTTDALNAESGLSYDGNTLNVTGSAPTISFTENNGDPDYKLAANGGVFKIVDTTNSADRFVVNLNGTGYFPSNFLVGGTTTSPGATFHVKNSYASVKIDTDGAGNDTNLSFKTNSGKENKINFGDASNDYSGQISFDHNGDHMKFRIGGTNKIIVNSNGLCFNNDTSADNALSDYEEGTWTPDWRGASALGTTSYGSYNAASYVKIGNQVTVRGHTQIAGSSGGSGFWFINNLPFTVGGGDDRRYRSVGSVMLEDFNFGDDVVDVVCFVDRNNNDMQIRGTRDNAGSSTSISVNNDTSFDIMFTVTYPTT